MTTMSDEEVLRLAEESGAFPVIRPEIDTTFVFYESELIRFAYSIYQLGIAEGERRERAKDVFIEAFSNWYVGEHGYEYGVDDAVAYKKMISEFRNLCFDSKNAIRARGDKEAG